MPVQIDHPRRTPPPEMKEKQIVRLQEARTGLKVQRLKMSNGSTRFILLRTASFAYQSGTDLH